MKQFQQNKERKGRYQISRLIFLVKMDLLIILEIFWRAYIDSNGSGRRIHSQKYCADSMTLIENPIFSKSIFHFNQRNKEFRFRHMSILLVQTIDFEKEIDFYQ